MSYVPFYDEDYDYLVAEARADEAADEANADAIGAEMDEHEAADNCILDSEGECAECVRLLDLHLAAR